MLPHHSQSIQNVKEYFQRDPEIQALLLSGSIAHGFQNPASDVDIMIFVSEEDYQTHFQTGWIHFFNRELCTYEGGYVEAFYERVKTFQPWSDTPYSWPAQFMLDSELNWMDGRTPVDDL
jgi:predicted nucleotidyltransferase